MQTFKNVMKAAKNDAGLFKSKLARFLLIYHSTINTTTGESSAELFFNHPIQTRLSLITPPLVATHLWYTSRLWIRLDYLLFPNVTLYRTARKFGRGKFGEFGKSSMIRQTKTIQSSTYN